MDHGESAGAKLRLEHLGGGIAAYLRAWWGMTRTWPGLTTFGSLNCSRFAS